MSQHRRPLAHKPEGQAASLPRPAAARPPDNPLVAEGKSVRWPGFEGRPWVVLRAALLVASALGGLVALGLMLAGQAKWGVRALCGSVVFLLGVLLAASRAESENP